MNKSALFSGHRNLPLRLFFLLLMLMPFFYIKEFYQHFYAYFSGNILTNLITHQWLIVLLSIMLFIAFLIPLSFRRRVGWSEYGLVSAFFISLFIEMYGIPFTIIFASKLFAKGPGITGFPNNIIEFSFLGVGIGMDLAMVYGALLMVIGSFLIILGWITLYKNIKKKRLVIEGLYSYSRHPQYLGFILIILGWFIGWPTILTLVFTPILIYKYIRLCKTEENEMSETATRNLSALAQSKRAVSEHAQEHAPPFRAAVLDISKSSPEYLAYRKRVPLFI